MTKDIQKVYYGYNDIHRIIQNKFSELKKFKADVIVGIGGGGFIPARIIRGFLKVPMRSVILELYNDDDEIDQDTPTKIQWLSEIMAKEFQGKRILVVDEVDDTRKTLSYCIQELKKSCKPSLIGAFVVHNKKKKKRGTLGNDVVYISGVDIEDKWIVYPWEAIDIDEHNKHLNSKIEQNNTKKDIKVVKK